jgi:hypothetical protein
MLSLKGTPVFSARSGSHFKRDLLISYGFQFGVGGFCPGRSRQSAPAKRSGHTVSFEPRGKLDDPAKLAIEIQHLEQEKSGAEAEMAVIAARRIVR